MKGRKHTAEAKRKNSEAHQGSKHPMYGRKHSEETKKKITGRPQSVSFEEASPRLRRHRMKKVRERLQELVEARNGA